MPVCRESKGSKAFNMKNWPASCHVEVQVKVGDKVLFGKYSGTELKLDGTDYLMMRESDILAII